MTTRNDAAARKGRSMARRLLAHHLGRAPRRVVVRSGGLTNLVFEAEHDEGAFVVRIGTEPDKLAAFIKEQWAMARSASAGVPVPEVLQVGSDVIGRPYMISRRVPGVPATECRDPLPVLREMGRLLATIHSIRTHGFGGTFDWSTNQLSHNASWRRFIDREFDAAGRIALLRKHRMLSPRRLTLLAKAIASVRASRAPATLNHGDLRLKNVVVAPDGTIAAILDWENSISAAGGAWDLSIALHDLAIDDKHALLEGYGIDAREFVALAPALKALNILNYAPRIAELASQRKGGALEMHRLRLSAALDLYAL